MVRKDDFDSSVVLPPGLDVGAIRRAIDYIESELVDLVELYEEQADVIIRDGKPIPRNGDEDS